MSDNTDKKEILFSPEDIPLLVDFVAEANEHLESAEAALLDLENTPNDNELLNQIFRAFHTMKGLAGFLDLSDIGSLAHSAENLLDLARKEHLNLVGDYVDAIFETIDMLKKMVSYVNEAIEQNSPLYAEEESQKLAEKLDQLCNSDSIQANSAVAEASDKGLSPELILPIEDVDADSAADVLSEEEELSNTHETASLPVELSPTVSDSKITSESKSIKTKVSNDKIKVSTSRLDYLVNTVGELVIAQLMLSEEINNNISSDNDLLRKISHQGKIVRELQELSMSMRMVPICDVFQKMNRLARDLSRKAGKDIAIEISGEETELDRTLVDKIADPLVHMVRNSVDHGIEIPDERVTNGKSKTGTLSLRAFHQSGKIVIEVEDNGKGLDKKRILEKAVNSGLIEKEQELSDEEIFKLIFHPGFSTAQKITNISGRGVGMDVVKKNIESLRGKVFISSTAGRGTKFSIQLPLTLAIIDGQIIKIGQERYIIPINSISHSFRPLDDQVFSVCDKGEMVMVQDELYPLIRLYEVFGIEPQTTNPCDALIVLVEDNNKKYCLLIDELLDQQQVVIKNLGDQIDQKGFTGGAIMGDGKVSLILDIPGLIELTKIQFV